MLDSSSSRYSDTHHEEPSLMDQYIPGKLAKPGQQLQFTKNGMPTTELPPKNGRYHVALLVGGPRDVARKIRERVGSERGILVKHHWETDRIESNNRPIPKDTDLVLILTDLIAHKEYFKVAEKAKGTGVRVIRTVTSRTQMNSAIRNYFRISPPIPLSVLSTTVFGDDVDEAPAAKEPEIPKYVRTAHLTPVPAPVVEVPVLGEVTAKAPLKAMDATPTVQIVVQQALSPIELPKRTPGIPSSQLAALAAALHQMCSEERVSILCTPTELNFSKAS